MLMIGCENSISFFFFMSEKDVVAASNHMDKMLVHLSDKNYKKQNGLMRRVLYLVVAHLSFD